MPTDFGDTVVRAFGQTYTLDLSSLNEARFLCLPGIGVSVLVLLAMARRFDGKSLAYTLAWGTLALFWASVYLYYFRLPLPAHAVEGHIYSLYWQELRQLLPYMALSTGLGAAAAMSLLLARAPAIAKLPLEQQLQAMWPRALLLLAVIGAWSPSLRGVLVLQNIAWLGKVPALEFPKHQTVQVGHPFSMIPQVRLVGAVQRHWFSAETPVYLDEGMLKSWKRPSEVYIAKQVGDNQFAFRIERASPLRFSVDATFHVDAAEERGNPLWTLHQGDTWRYRIAGPARKAQSLVQEFQRNAPLPAPAKGKKPDPDPSASETKMVTIRVDGAQVEDGVRIWELVVDNPAATDPIERHLRHSVTMWDGETYLEWNKRRVPLITATSDAAPPGESLYPCKLAVLRKQEGCLCNLEPIDGKRQLTGLARCIQVRVNSHIGENLFVLGLGILTLGMTSLGPNGLRMRNDERSYVGLLLEKSGTE